MAMTQEDFIDVMEFYSDLFANAWLDALLFAIGLGLVSILFKSLLDNVAGYITFRLDKWLKQGTLIAYKDQVWRIKTVNLTTLVLESKTGYMSVPLKKWNTHGFIIVKDGHEIGSGRST